MRHRRPVAAALVRVRTGSQDAVEQLKNLPRDLKLSKALPLAAGHFKVPVSPECLTSASKIDFIEREPAGDPLGPGRDWGVRLNGDIKALSTRLGVFQGDGRTDHDRARDDGGGRARC